MCRSGIFEAFEKTRKSGELAHSVKKEFRSRECPNTRTFNGHLEFWASSRYGVLERE